MSKGYVYILSNESMPGLVKIGRTARGVEQRAFELYQTGVPTPFKVEHCVTSPDCIALERDMHNHFPDVRVSGSREFFRTDIGTAVALLDDLLREQIIEIVTEYLPDHSVVSWHEFVDPSTVNHIADATGNHPAIISAALSDLSPQEAMPAIKRITDRMKRIREKAMSPRPTGEVDD